SPRRPPRPPLFPYTTLFRSVKRRMTGRPRILPRARSYSAATALAFLAACARPRVPIVVSPTPTPRPARGDSPTSASSPVPLATRSEEHTSELQSLAYLVCRL